MTTLVLGRESATVEAIVSAARSRGLAIAGAISDAEALARLDSGQTTTFLIGGGVDQHSRETLKQRAHANSVAVLEEPLAGRDIATYVQQVLVPYVDNVSTGNQQ